MQKCPSQSAFNTVIGTRRRGQIDTPEAVENASGFHDTLLSSTSIAVVPGNDDGVK